MATIALRVTGLKAEVDEQQLRAAFAVHGYVQDVSFSDEDGERVATVRRRRTIAANFDSKFARRNRSHLGQQIVSSNITQCRMYGVW